MFPNRYIAHKPCGRFTWTAHILSPSQPATVVCKMEAQLEYVYITYLHVFARLELTCMLSRCLKNKISASEFSRNFIKSALLVGINLPQHVLPCPVHVSARKLLQAVCWSGLVFFLTVLSGVLSANRRHRPAHRSLKSIHYLSKH